jgi:hypothetical protein
MRVFATARIYLAVYGFVAAYDLSSDCRFLGLPGENRMATWLPIATTLMPILLLLDVFDGLRQPIYPADTRTPKVWLQT